MTKPRLLQRLLRQAPDAPHAGLRWVSGHALLLCVLALAGLFAMHRRDEALEQALRVHYPQTQLVAELDRALGRIAKDMRDALALDDAEAASRLHAIAESIGAQDRRMTRALSALQDGMHDAPGLALLEKLRSVHAVYVVNQDDFVRLLRQHRLGEARNLLRVDLSGYQDRYGVLLEQLMRQQDEQLRAAVQRAEDAQRGVSLLLGLLALLLVLGPLMLIRLARPLQ